MKFIYIIFFYLLSLSLNAKCNFISIKNIYKNEILKNKRNYITDNKECIKKIEGYSSNFFIRKNRKIHVNELSKINEKVIIDFNNGIYVEFNNSHIVAKNRNYLKIKKNDRIKKININGEFR